MVRKRPFSFFKALTIGTFFCVLLFAILLCRDTFGPDKPVKGICSNHSDSPFVLPYPVGLTYLCIQGYTGPNYHPEIRKYAVDFAMPIGSTVVAARSGRVVFIEESFEDGDYGEGKENVVVIQHEDGTYSRYVHLTRNGALGSLQQLILQGESIGLSGNSGQSLSPHLHFDVTGGDGTRSAQTIPVCFKNTKPHPDGLETGVYYTAERYEK
ncbi:MAG: M23 family metallopeptidase [Candidatus Aminicenantes bacterium]|nr:M23 family metallopeptidase [Candidatus Aminicenantes bacterium]MDH5385464.1 M23 family metallopeptidase [Candidatus Aminicenantes bacterium]MDH5742517.1 M23 family metallopeptidase [Candidatus Aminicenantes bacterium]